MSRRRSPRRPCSAFGHCGRAATHVVVSQRWVMSRPGGLVVLEEGRPPRRPRRGPGHWVKDRVPVCGGCSAYLAAFWASVGQRLRRYRVRRVD